MYIIRKVIVLSKARETNYYLCATTIGNASYLSAAGSVLFSASVLASLLNTSSGCIARGEGEKECGGVQGGEVREERLWVRLDVRTVSGRVDKSDK